MRKLFRKTAPFNNISTQYGKYIGRHRHAARLSQMGFSIFRCVCHHFVYFQSSNRVIFLLLP